MLTFSERLADKMKPQLRDFQKKYLDIQKEDSPNQAPASGSSIWRSQSVAGGGNAAGSTPWTQVERYTGGEREYQEALYDWMRASPEYQDWSDYKIGEFVRAEYDRQVGEDASGGTAAAESLQQKGETLWEDSRQAWEEAKQQSAADREHMLAQLAEFKAGYGDNWVSMAVSREVQEGLARKQQMIEGMREDAARRGRVLSPWVAAEIGRRLDADIADAAQVRRMEMEQVSARMREVYLNQLRSVYADTQHQTTDPAAALAMLEKLGAGDSTVQAHTPQPQPQTTQPNWNRPSQIGLDAPERELGL